LLEVKSLHEEPPGIAMDIQLHELQAVNLEWGDLHKRSMDPT